MAYEMAYGHVIPVDSPAMDLTSLRSLEKEFEVVEVEPGHVLMVCGTCFHGGCKNDPVETTRVNKSSIDKSVFGFIRLHGYITTPFFNIGQEELTQGWYSSYFVNKILEKFGKIDR